MKTPYILLMLTALISSATASGQVLPVKSGSVIEKRVLRNQFQEAQVISQRGKLQWQQSVDGINWINLPGKEENKALVMVNNYMFLRCAIGEANCDAVYSDILKLIPIDPPTVTTSTIPIISGTAARGGGNVISDGNATVTAKGICWSVEPDPVTSGSKTMDGSGTGPFTSSLTGLAMNTIYYVRAYATNIAGTAYGEQVSFKTDRIIMVPRVITSSVNMITETSATGGGNVTDNGGATVTTRGIYWSTSNNPGINDSKSEVGSGIGSFSVNIPDLTPNTQYYVKAFATNSAGTGYGSLTSFKTRGANDETGSFMDLRDNRVYDWVKLGEQVWMGENLAWLPDVTGPAYGSTTFPLYYVYGYTGTSVYEAKNTENYAIYGTLYNWPAALKACPEEWHLPTDSEWTTLTKFLNGGSVAGGKMKEAETIHWKDPNYRADNSSNFTGLPAGDRSWWLDFYYLGETTFFWSATESDAVLARNRSLGYKRADLENKLWTKEYGFSIRCVRNN